MGPDRGKQRHPRHQIRRQALALTGTAVWTVEDEKLQRGWVEQASFELYHYLLAK